MGIEHSDVGMKHGHGYVNLDKSLIQSCDVYFYQMYTRYSIR